MNYDVVIGIEIHIELKTKTKMFSRAPYDFKAKANTCANEIDLALPGTLPCVNEEAVIKALQTCMALNLTIDDLLKFDRKNYYYADLPKGYQITQQFHPLGRDGYIELEGGKKVRINRLHMEEDTAKQFHLSSCSLVDYNRAGVPLIEVVSEADMSSAKEAMSYVEKLRQTVEYLDASDAKMEEGSLRCDVNISLKEAGSNVYGTKVEIKNLNSIANIGSAIEYEIKRQGELLEKGEKIIQETRRYDERNEVTVAMRKKEGTIDYKYFPEPNIFPIRLSKEFIENARSKMAELPSQKAERYINNYGLKEYDVQLLLNKREVAAYFDCVMQDCRNAKVACNMLNSELVGLLAKQELDFENNPISSKHFAQLINILDEGKISSKQAKEVLNEMLKGESPEKIIKDKGLEQISDEATLLKMINEVLDANEQSIIDFKNGKTHVQGYLVGQLMKKSQGKANPALAAKLIAQELAKR